LEVISEGYPDPTRWHQSKAMIPSWDICKSVPLWGTSTP